MSQPKDVYAALEAAKQVYLRDFTPAERSRLSKLGGEAATIYAIAVGILSERHTSPVAKQ